MSTDLQSDRAHERAPAPGTVCLTVLVTVPPAAAWRALTDPALVQAWFGNLSGPLQPGGRAILDFGDGDFFALEQIRLAPPGRAQYSWRFLGIGPRETICWHVAPRGGGCAVTITDADPERPPEMTALLREGWMDFTGRLVRFLATGRPTRYDWRREVDGSIELSCCRSAARDALLAPAAIPAWLPLAGRAGESGDRLALAADGEPDCCAIAGSAVTSPDQVSFEVRHARCSGVTRCRLWLSDRRRGALLSVNHVGWEGLGPDPQEPPSQRRRFAQFWIEALRRARALCEANE